jgi:hypothetical protein
VKKPERSILSVVLITVFVSLSLSFPGMVRAGDLDPPAGPADPASAIHTIDDVYNLLDTGVPQAKRAGGFTEPGSAPGSTGHTLDELYDKINVKCVICDGTMNGTRWCDNGDGTVTDMTTGLVWLQDSSWGDLYAFWVNTVGGTNAHDRAAQISDATAASLSDGSVEGDWRLPTKSELYGLANGTEPVRYVTPRAFTGVQSDYYWSSTTYAPNTGNAWNMNLFNGDLWTTTKDSTLYVWPVRNDN